MNRRKISARFLSGGLVLALTFLSAGCGQQPSCRLTADLDALYTDDIPFDMPRYQLPEIPDKVFCISDFGGIGDGVADNTEAFAAAVSAIAENRGGRLVVPQGIWLTGPIEFTDHMELRVERGAVLLFSKDHSLYKLIQSTFEGWTAYRCTSPLSAYQRTDIAITGEGVIDGQGDSWRPVKKGKMTDSQWKQLLKSGVTNEKGNIWFPSEGGRLGYENPALRNSDDPAVRESVRDFYRPVLLSFRSCRNVLLSSVTFQNSPAWCLHPFCCENVVLYNLTVRNPWYSQNGDGLDLESSTNTIVHKCTFDVGDDAICIKSGKDAEGRQLGKPTQDALIVGNTVYHAHGGFVIGSEMSGGARRLYVKNCSFIGTDIGLRFKSTRGRGGVVEDIYIDGIQMADIATDALSFNLYYSGNSPVLDPGDKPDDIRMDLLPPVDETTPVFRKIYVNNVTCNGAAQAMLFNGLPEMKLTDVEVRHSVFKAQRGAMLAQVDGVLLEDVVIEPETGEKITTYQAENVTVR